MNAAKHTLGPWTQDKYGNVKTPSGGTLVTDGVAFGGYSTEETRANARLIAAAPDLLAFAKWFIENRDGPGASMALAAIAKAEGGAA